MMLVEVNIRNPLQADKDSAGDLDNCLERVQLKVVRTCASEYGLNAFSRLLAFDCAVGRSINEVPLCGVTLPLSSSLASGLSEPCLYGGLNVPNRQ